MMLPQRVRARCEPDETHIIKWTAEGAVKGAMLSILRRMAHVSCRGYVGILQSAQPML